MIRGVYISLCVILTSHDDGKEGIHKGWAPDRPLTDTSKSKVEGKKRYGHHLSFILSASFVFLSLSLPPSLPTHPPLCPSLCRCCMVTQTLQRFYIWATLWMSHTPVRRPPSLKSFFSFFPVVFFFLPGKTKSNQTREFLSTDVRIDGTGQSVFFKTSWFWCSRHTLTTVIHMRARTHTQAVNLLLHRGVSSPSMVSLCPSFICWLSCWDMIRCSGLNAVCLYTTQDAFRCQSKRLSDWNTAEAMLQATRLEVAPLIITANQ